MTTLTSETTPVIRHLEMLLEWLDVLISLQVERFRYLISQGRSEASLQQLYIPHEEVNWHLRTSDQEIPSETNLRIEKFRSISASLKMDIAAFEQSCLDSDVELPLVAVKERLGLSAFERDILVICLAPEFDRKYDRLYAYLQDDIIRKRPSTSLILDLLCESRSEKWEKRTLLDDNGTLLRYGLLTVYHDLQFPSGCSDLSRFLSCGPELLAFCSGTKALGKSMRSFADIINCQFQNNSYTDQTIEKLIKWAHLETDSRRTLPMAMAYIRAVCQSDIRFATEMLCMSLSRLLITVDIPLLLAGNDDIFSVISRLFTCALLHDAVLLFEGADALEKQTERAVVFLRMLPKCIESYNVLTIAVGQNDWRVDWGNNSMQLFEISIGNPEYTIQKELWDTALSIAGTTTDIQAVERIAESYRLSSCQIQSSARMAARMAAMRDSDIASENEIVSAVRMVAARSLLRYGIRIEPRVQQQDLILPEATASQVTELCRHARFSNRVYREWGFGSTSTSCKGVSALLYGPPGTGKTMTAEVIAGDLNLELYKVDLSMVVSKYIGETEKNLGSVFNEAQSMNAVLFFDEADALFGKRTEISDSHDRYANIEVSFLLQRIETYEGIVLLASNLKGNIDDAFMRRFRFIIELPFPDCENRHKIWLRQFPSSAPLESDIEFSAIAETYPLSGGNIKNAALRAAFTAAADSVPIGTSHLLHGIRQEYQKMGKTWTDTAQVTNRTTKGILSRLR